VPVLVLAFPVTLGSGYKNDNKQTQRQEVTERMDIRDFRTIVEWQFSREEWRIYVQLAQPLSKVNAGPGDWFQLPDVQLGRCCMG